MSFLRVVVALLRRDWENARTYRLAWTLWLADVVLAMAAFFFLGALVDAEQRPLAEYGGYAPFALIGVGLFGYFFNVLTRVGGSLRNAQLNGTLEAVLVTRTSVFGLVLGTAAATFVARTFMLAGYLVLGVVLFGIRLGAVAPTTVALFWLAGVVLFTGLAMISSSFIIVVKKGDPLSWALGTLTWVAGGTFYPVDVLPAWARLPAEWFPLTSLIEGMRAGLLAGRDLSQLRGDLSWLAACSVISAATGLLSLRLAWDKARRDGTLQHY